jgi:hypothetical protein
LTMERPQNLSSAGMRSANNASVTRTFIWGVKMKLSLFCP